MAAALAGDAAAVASAPPDVIAAARTARPGLVVWAAAQDQVAAVELLVRAGFDVNACGRSDMPIEQNWETALHAAVQRGSVPLVRRLLHLGADPALRDKRFDGTPLDWADYFDQPQVAAVPNE